MYEKKKMGSLATGKQLKNAKNPAYASSQIDQKYENMQYS